MGETCFERQTSGKPSAWNAAENKQAHVPWITTQHSNPLLAIFFDSLTADWTNTKANKGQRTTKSIDGHSRLPPGWKYIKSQK